MRLIRTARTLTTALAVACAALVLMAIVLISRGTQTASLLATRPTQVTAPSLHLGIRAQATDLRVVQDSPLFYATRRFYTAPVVSAPPTPPLPAYRLVGTFIIPNKPALAFLKNESSGTSRKVAPGETLDGWVVRAVETRRVVIQYGQESREIVPAPSNTPMVSATAPSSPTQALPGAVSGMTPTQTTDTGRSAYLSPRQTTNGTRLYRGVQR